MNILVTGGAGFIGSNFLNRFVPRHPEHQFTNLDALTYAADLRSTQPLEAHGNLHFERADICDPDAVEAVFQRTEPDVVVHFAAESHVDRSILGPLQFVRTNIEGTLHLLEACRRHWTASDGSIDRGLFCHVSTDEVYGSLGDTGLFTEASPYDPSSPYAASKASSDHLVRAWHRTYGLPVKITNCSNNYGPWQFPEKLIPLMILHAVDGKALPIYGEGLNVRDWLFVEDHCEAIWAVMERGRVGRTYNIGGNCERRNIDVVDAICDLVAEATGRDPGAVRALKTFVKDRPGHDLRYAIDATRIREECGWAPSETFETGLRRTVAWYLAHRDWVETIRSGAYAEWMDANYGGRG